MFPIRSLALIVAATLATSVPLTACAQAAPAPQAQPQAAQQATGWQAEGYDGTDASLAQYAYDHGQMIEGYGVDVSKVYDTSKPYGWKANPDTGEWEYVGYCGDASLAEGEGEPEADRATGKRCAAEMILLRLKSDGQLFEDWTYQDAPAAVTEFHDALIEDYRAEHGSYAFPADFDSGDAQRFLSRVALVDSAF
jgi:hypothetical protein